MRAWHELKRLVLDVSLRTIGAAVISLAGIGVLVWVAVLGQGDEPPSETLAIVLVILGAILQVASAYLFNGSGRADTSHARSAIVHMLGLVAQARQARQLAEGLRADGDTKALRAGVGELSVHLSYIEEGAAEGAQHWAEFHDDARRRLEEESQNEPN